MFDFKSKFPDITLLEITYFDRKKEPRIREVKFCTEGEKEWQKLMKL